MKKADFLRIIGAGKETEYAPVAGMLRDGYAFAGYFNSRLNKDIDDTLILVNTRLVDIREKGGSRSQPRISDFNEFVEEIALSSYGKGKPSEGPRKDVYGTSIPLAAVAFGEVVVVYPIDQIGKLLAKLEREQKKVPRFLDVDNESLVLKILRVKLW